MKLLASIVYWTMKVTVRLLTAFLICFFLFALGCQFYATFKDHHTLQDAINLLIVLGGVAGLFCIVLTFSVLYEWADKRRNK